MYPSRRQRVIAVGKEERREHDSHKREGSNETTRTEDVCTQGRTSDRSEAARHDAMQLRLIELRKQRADEKNRNAMLESAQGRGFGAYPLLLNDVPFSCITRD